VILHQCEQEREWTAHEIAFVEAIANQCAIALTLVQLEQRYQSECIARQQAESALKASEARNQAFLEAVPDLILRVSRDGIYLECKAAKEDTLLMPAHEIIGKHLHDCLPTEVAGLAWHHIELALETNKIQIIEYQLWLNGKDCHFEARIAKSGVDEVAVIVQDITERVQGRVALQQVNDALELRVAERTAALREANHTLRAEIVERKRIEKALRESEERFRRAIVNAPFPIMIHAEDGEVLQINEVWTDLTGYTHEDIPTITQWTQKAFGKNNDTVQAGINQLYDLKHKVHEGEFTLTAKTGSSKIWNFSSASLGQLADGRRLVISMATDVSARRQAEQEIRLLHSIKQAIFESQDFHAALKVALQKVCEATGWDFGEAWVPTVDGSVLECSPAWHSNSKHLESFRSLSEKLTFLPGVGLPGRVWVSQQPEWRRDVSAESEQIYLRTQMAREAGLKAGLGIPLLTTNGVLAVLVFYMFESQDEDQQLIELISASTELGLMIQRKQAEGEIRKALEKEKELTELKSRFVSMTSHEFRTPLTTIQSSAELIERYSQRWSEEKKQIHLYRIQTSVKHMTKLLNDILIIGKAEAGKLEYSPVPLDLEKFCSNLVEELKLNDTNQHIITFQVGNGESRMGSEEIDDSSEAIKSMFDAPYSPLGTNLPCLDEKLLRQILENLLSNALKYSPSNTSVEFTLYYHQNQAIFQIRDQGIGIPNQDKDLLFETFHRATNVGTIAGTGLGLAIVKKCVELHKGRIAVESEVGLGTTFTVTLPV
jgi:PAS domain S-box-containing protein